MYDADEQLRDIKDIAQTTANTVKNGIDLAQRLRQMMQSGTVAEMAVNDPSFVFTGQSTDLRSFADRTNINVSKRFLVLDISEMGDQLRSVGLQIILEYVWQRVIPNMMGNAEFVVEAGEPEGACPYL